MLAEVPSCSNLSPPRWITGPRWSEEPRIYLARYDVEPVIEPGDETKQVFTATVTIPIDRAAFESLKSGNSHLFLHGRSLFLASSERTTSRPSVSLTTSTSSDLSAGQAATTNVPAPPGQGRGDRQGPSEGHARGGRDLPPRTHESMFTADRAAAPPFLRNTCSALFVKLSGTDDRAWPQ